jgi:VanZ family protein
VQTLSRKSVEQAVSGRNQNNKHGLSGNLVRNWLPVALWLCVIFFMSTGSFSADNTSSVVGTVLGFLFPGMSADTVASIDLLMRKAAHVTEYFILSVLLFRCFKPSQGPWKWRYHIYAVAGVMLWALSDELHQLFVPERTGSLMDVGIDTTGGIFAQVMILLWNRRPWSR